MMVCSALTVTLNPILATGATRDWDICDEKLHTGWIRGALGNQRVAGEEASWVGMRYRCRCHTDPSARHAKPRSAQTAPQ